MFVALSLLVLFGFSNATSAIGFSDSLGAFLAGLVLAGTPYSHDIIHELRAFKAGPSDRAHFSLHSVSCLVSTVRPGRDP